MNTLTDSFGRHIDYLRLSVTDRCDLRCIYCMAEEMKFTSRQAILSIEELCTVADSFIRLGVSKIRITGGEPLVRQNVLSLFEHLGRQGLKDLSLTTNGTRLSPVASALCAAGVHRVNISLDTLCNDKFRKITRVGDLNAVLAGIKAASRAGFSRIKLNSVIMKGKNCDEIVPLMRFALDSGLDISFIEEMPLGSIDSHERAQTFIRSDEIREVLSQHFNLSPSPVSTGGPSRYWNVQGYTSRVGFISPHSENFCASCNRVRVNPEGQLLLCLGNEHSADLKRILRFTPPEYVHEKLDEAIVRAMAIKPEKHHFDLNTDPQILRFMNSTGG